MRVSALIVSLLAGGTAAPGGQQQRAPLDFAHMSSDGQDVRKTVLGDGIYQFTVMRDAYVRVLNTVVIVNDNDVLVFDTNTRPSSARIIVSEIRKITSKPVRYVV